MHGVESDACSGIFENEEDTRRARLRRRRAPHRSSLWAPWRQKGGVCGAHGVVIRVRGVCDLGPQACPLCSVCPQPRYRELPACAETQAMMHGRAHGWSLSLVSRESKLTPGAGFYRLRINHDEPSGQSNPGSIAHPFREAAQLLSSRTTIDPHEIHVRRDGW